MRTTRIITGAAAAAALSLTLAACGDSAADDASNAVEDVQSAAADAQTEAESAAEDAQSAVEDAVDGEATVITVGASPVPHAVILQYIDDELAADAGIDLEIVEFTDYVQPNVALSEGEIDANYFQHVPYFDAEVAEKGYEFEHSVGIHIEPYGVYSETVTSLDELADGATVSVPNDPSNQARALELLEANGLFTLDASVEDPTIYDVADNPKNIQLTELDAAQLAITLQDVDAAVINGNFALDAGLVPSEDAFVVESGEDNPYANVLAYRTEDADAEGIQTLITLLTSDEVRTFIEENWPNGELIPAF